MEDRIRRGNAGEQSTGEWASSEVRDRADAARLRTLEAKGCAARAKEYVQGAIQETREYVEGVVQQAHDKMTEYREGGFEEMKHDVAGYTREQPMTALLIAAGVGLVLGWLSAVGRR